MVLRSAASPTGEWLEEQVDLVADYRAAFGEAPPDPSQIAIQADTDNTDSTSRAQVADLAFVARGGAGERPVLVGRRAGLDRGGDRQTQGDGGRQAR